MRRIIKLTERDLHNVIKESVKRALNEGSWDDEDDYISWDDIMNTNPEQAARSKKIDESNAIINDIGSQTEPWFKKMEEFKLKYRTWLQDNLDNPHQNTVGYNFDGRFAKAFDDVYNGLYTINFIYGH